MIDAAWFRNRMKQLNLTQEDLAQALGKDRSTFSRIIAGEFEFKPNYIDIFAEHLKCDRTEIMLHAGFLRDDDFINLKANFDHIESAIEAFKNGAMLIVTDDYDRENEGDLIIAARHCTPEKMAFIVRHTSGIVCAPISRDIARRLRLDPMVHNNDAPHSTAFTVSIDAKYVTTTGISAAERTITVQALADNNLGPDAFVRPGHIFPLIAQEGGVLVRTGHTEAAVDLCRLSQLPEVGVICEMVNDDGSVMRGDDIDAFSAQHNIIRISIAELIAYRQSKERLVNRTKSFAIQSRIGQMMAYSYITHNENLEHVALVYGDIKKHKNVLVRLHRADMFDDVFGGDSFLNRCLDEFKNQGHGVLIYLRDGAIGVPKTQMQEKIPQDSAGVREQVWREIGIGAQILRDLSIDSIDILTRSNHKFAAINGFGIKINEVRKI